MSRLIAALTALALVTATKGDEGKAANTRSLATTMAGAANEFLNELRPLQRAKAMFAADDPVRMDWHWIPKPTRKGVKLGELVDHQKRLAEQLIRTGLSQTGYEKSLAIRRMEAALKILENDTRGVRDPDKYYISIFGKPAREGRWGWSCEGHHFSINYWIENGEVIESTPTFLGANPRTTTKQVQGGPAAGVVLLGEEERLGFELATGLAADGLTKAIFDGLPPRTLQTGPPKDLYAGPPVGVARGQMSAVRQRQLDELISLHAANLPPAVAQNRLAALEAAGRDDVFFMWTGAVDLDKPHYFRVHGPTLILELDNVQADPLRRPANHIHSVWRKPRPAK